MARDTSDNDTGSTRGEDRTGAEHQPRECMPCRGSGRVISNLGGRPSSVTCPWCRGTGVRVPGADAQSRWLEQREQAAGGGAPPDPAS